MPWFCGTVAFLGPAEVLRCRLLDVTVLRDSGLPGTSGGSEVQTPGCQVCAHVLYMPACDCTLTCVSEESTGVGDKLWIGHGRPSQLPSRTTAAGAPGQLRK